VSLVNKARLLVGGTLAQAVASLAGAVDPALDSPTELATLLRGHPG
jgi:hypothetical protein